MDNYPSYVGRLEYMMENVNAVYGVREDMICENVNLGMGQKNRKSD